MFKERNTKLTLLSLLSALVVASTAFAGVSIYAQQADDNMTSTTEDSGLANNATSLDSSSDDSSDGVNASETSTAASIADIFSGLVICDLGTLTVNDPTEVAAADLNATGTPTITITVMDRTEVAAASENDTSTAADDASSAGCLQLEGGTSASNTTGTADNATLADNATSTSSANMTSTSNATSIGDASASDEDLTTFEEEALNGSESDNATSAANSTDMSSNATSAANATSTGSSDASADEGQIVAIDGEDFAPGQVVLVFTDNALLAVDDVDEDGSIDAKVPMDKVDSELRFIESGTMRTATASFAEGDTQDETVVAGSQDQDIRIVMAGDNSEDTGTASSFSSNSTSMSSGNATSMTNSTSSNSTSGNSTDFGTGQ